MHSFQCEHVGRSLQVQLQDGDENKRPEYAIALEVEVNTGSDFGRYAGYSHCRIYAAKSARRFPEQGNLDHEKIQKHRPLYSRIYSQQGKEAGLQ